MRLIIQYVFSKTKMLVGHINMWSEEILADESDLKDLRLILKDLEMPFGFMSGFQMEHKVKANADEKLK